MPSVISGKESSGRLFVHHSDNSNYKKTLNFSIEWALVYLLMDDVA